MEFEQCKPGTEELRAGSVLGVFECCVESCTGQANLVREISLLSNIMGNQLLQAMAAEQALQEAAHSATEGGLAAAHQIRAGCS